MIVGSFIIFKILINAIIWHDNLLVEMKFNPSDTNKQSEIIKQYSFSIKIYFNLGYKKFKDNCICFISNWCRLYARKEYYY